MICPKVEHTEEERPCPDCGRRLISGYGFAGGGLGSYEMCDCGFFRKEHEDEVKNDLCFAALDNSHKVD